MKRLFLALLIMTLAGFTGGAAFAQDGQVSGDQDGSSQAVEESDEAYRRRMELEDARNRDPTYTDPPDDYRRDLEKIDKLPKESRENIRDQLIDIIVENPEWEPEDALEEYPYEPSAAAMADAELMQQEQEAWEEQIEKYHAREAAAYGAYRGAVAGPGNPGGQDGSSGGEGNQGSQDGTGQGQGQQGSEGANTSAGTYQPYESQSEQSEESVSTRGVSESALDFLLRQQAGQEQSSQAAEAPQQSVQEQSAQAQSSDSQSDSESAAEPNMRGILAIEDLDKMEGTSGAVTAPPQNENEDEGSADSEEGDATGGG